MGWWAPWVYQLGTQYSQASITTVITTSIHEQALRSMENNFNPWGRSTTTTQLRSGGEGRRAPTILTWSGLVEEKWVWGDRRRGFEANWRLGTTGGLVTSSFSGGDVENESGRRQWMSELERVTMRDFAWESFERLEESFHMEWLRERERGTMWVFIILIGLGVK